MLHHRIVQFPVVPRLSCILCSRNDQYMGNSRWRLETSLNVLAEEARARGLGPEDLEVLVADWGSDVPLHEVVRLTDAAVRLTTFLPVAPDHARTHQGASPFAEVLALNAAARRATGDFIGRIDQDTLVGGRFLDWFFQGHADAGSLYFANRRDLPYRFAAPSPPLGIVRRFVAEQGDRMPVHRHNPFTGHLYWTSAVGIWLASRDLWEEAGGYDERLIFYNWMETDMIHRLRSRHPIIDLGTLTDWNFYHLEHYHPLRSWASRPHALKNQEVDLSVPAADARPSGGAWGLPSLTLVAARATRTPVSVEPAGRVAYACVRLWLWIRMTADTVTIAALAGRARLGSRVRRLLGTFSGRPVAEWPSVARALWRGRAAARARRLAGFPWAPLRHAAAGVLARTGLLPAARRWRSAIRLAGDPAVRARARSAQARFERFRATHGHLWPAPVTPTPGRRAVVVSSRCPSVETELATITAVRLAGYAVTVLLEDEERALAPFYELAGASVRLWSAFLPAASYDGTARRLLRGCLSLDDMMSRTHGGVRVGRIAACTALRDLQLGEVTVSSGPDRAALTRRLAASLGAVDQAGAILDALDPQLLVTDHEYTPKGELFECALARGLDVVAYDSSHRADALVFKRYRADNRDRHLTTLGPETWAALQRMPWTEENNLRVTREIAACYEGRDWYLSGGPATTSGRDDVRRRLGLSTDRPVAAIFPHVLWDAPVLWGTPLFPSYQEWFLRTMRIAYAHTGVDWLVKLHPSHVWREALSEEPEEVRVLARLGPRPPHVTLIPADTPLTTRELLTAVDYCVTVRGTVGVEAARLGIPVITAGEARYTHHGFTVDSATAGAYLDRLRHIERTPPLAPAARELAERFAYGAFLARPWRLTSLVPTPDGCEARIADARAWAEAPDIRALSAWFTSAHEDFLASATLL